MAEKHYVWGLDLSQSLQGAGGIGGLIASVDNAGAVHHYLYDANGNVGQLVAGDGRIAARYEYDPFGNEIAAEGEMAEENPFRFSTKYWDAETGLYYYGRRYYSPEMGRWPSRDPISEKGGLNFYQAFYNNPFEYSDPYGERNWKAYINDREKISPAVAWLRDMFGLYDYTPTGDVIADMVNDLRTGRADAVRKTGLGIAATGEIVAGFHDGADICIVVSEWKEGMFDFTQLLVLMPVVSNGVVKVYDKCGKLRKTLEADDVVKNMLKREFYDADDAASEVLQKRVAVTNYMGDIGPVKNSGVRDDLESLGYDPNDFRAVQYEAFTEEGERYIITVFEAEGGVYFGPHLSSANW